MIKQEYRAQVELLLDVLPYIAKEKCFALKGGTAINMFIWDMPRLSVDIDLTYIYFNTREEALWEITESLLRIKTDLNNNLPYVRVEESSVLDGQVDKIVCLRKGAKIKVEVNTVMRGVIQPVEKMPVSQFVRDDFNKFAVMQVQSRSELFGGKICAALDRQHPRDLFDVYRLFGLGGIGEEIKGGFIASLLSHDKSIHAVLNPNLQDQRQAFKRQFEGMTNQEFNYADFESTRETLIKDINNLLGDNDKKLLWTVKSGDPDWGLSSIERLQDLPAVKWKLQNVRRLKSTNPTKHKKLLNELEKILFN